LLCGPSSSEPSLREDAAYGGTDPRVPLSAQGDVGRRVSPFIAAGASPMAEGANDKIGVLKQLWRTNRSSAAHVMRTAYFVRNELLHRTNTEHRNLVGLGVCHLSHRNIIVAHMGVWWLPFSTPWMWLCARDPGRRRSGCGRRWRRVHIRSLSLRWRRESSPRRLGSRAPRAYISTTRRPKNSGLPSKNKCRATPLVRPRLVMRRHG
jgi:hypothetical protein